MKYEKLLNLTINNFFMDITVNENTVLVFDLDDTLYNEIDFLRSAYTEISKQLNPDNWELLFVNMFSRYRQQLNVFNFLSETYAVPKNQLIESYRNHKPLIKPKKNVITVFEKIRKNNGKIAIITDGRSTTQKQKIKALNIEPFLDLIIISEETGFEKPHKNNFQLVETKFKNCKYYYIADNFRKDFITPNELGWKTVGLIDSGLNIHNDAYKYVEEKHSPNHLIFSFQDLNII
ncbi:hypothetical protein APS56_15885 [Pseudalgibacter alginicilyticus]|uniref:HAD family hydrolase n=1 Tax=Pseudalgibacter alginicilyticus TaxID=1736674 RepID=A0A0P0CUC7_9FLAO|nr:HAD family hydrolase [Pseudalgibacter alginicilyticus]ALJ06523.1 hypothetical protein APS56_15885 [Pseudalgibacter alginicilyticus]